MYEVTIPLRPVKDNEVGNPEDYFKIIRDEYASRYLEMLNIASTPANKADFVRYRMMDDCDMMGIWPDLRTSALADAIRIVPPLRQRIGDLADINESDRNKWAQWYGQADPISVRPPDLSGVTFTSVKLDDDDDRAGGDAMNDAVGGLVANLSLPSDAQSPVGNRAELAAELERVRTGGANGMEVTKRLGVASSRFDAERKERMKEELVSLKAKFILPYACERVAKEGSLSGPSRKSELVVWPMTGSLIVDAPEAMWGEVLQPVRVALEDVNKNTCKWVDDSIPLEFLTSRRDDAALSDVRRTLKDPDIGKLTGLLSHLLQWTALMPLRKDGPQLSESALQALFVAVHELWSQFEKLHRDSKWGVSFVLPCIMLTLKRGIERIFEISYPTLMSNEVLRQKVIDRINILLMRLFDPDSAYSRFGKFDGEGKAILLSKKLDAIMASQGSTHTKRLHARMHRSTPLVRAVIGLLGSGKEHGDIADTKTRVMMLQGDQVGSGSASSVVHPPQDKANQAALFKAVRDRLPFEEKRPATFVGEPHQPRSARQPQNPKRPVLQNVGPASARSLGTNLGAAVPLSPLTSGGGVSVTATPAANSTTSGFIPRSGVGGCAGAEVETPPKHRERLPVLPRPARKPPMTTPRGTSHATRT